jgi:NADH dehydrogenase
MGEVVDVDTTGSCVILEDGDRVPYDFLVVSTGSTHHYFGKDQQWSPLAPGLKTVEDATEIRRRILQSFEEAERAEDPVMRERFLTFVIVGGGPTGMEMAGAICELAHHTLRRDFRAIDPASARVLLIENSPLVLDKYHPTLSVRAREMLEALGATVMNETRLTEIGDGYVMVQQKGEEKRIEAQTVLWAAGVKASPLGALLCQRLGVEGQLDRAGRVRVGDDCSIPGHPNVFVIGDLAAQNGADGSPLPGVAPVAMQQGQYVARKILAMLAGRAFDEPFRYWNKGNMATIGRSRAIMEIGNWRASGKIAWLAWLFIHILYVARFENRVLVLFQWFWNYVTRNRSARLITHK